MEQMIIGIIAGALIGFLLGRYTFTHKERYSVNNNNIEKEIIELKEQNDLKNIETNELKTKIEVKEKEIELIKENFNKEIELIKESSDKKIELINKNSSEKLEFKNQMLEAVGKSVTETTQKEQKPYIDELVKKEQRLSSMSQKLEQQQKDTELKEREILKMHAEANMKKEYSSSARGLDCQQVMEQIIMSSGYEKGKSVIFDKKQEGIKGRPDATLIYPMGRKICCDAKAPLGKFDEIIDAGQKGDAEKIEKLKSEFGEKIINHVNWLSGKEYERAKNSEDYILMFLPSAVHEQLAREATQLHQKDLDKYAQSKKIYIVSPGTFTPYVQNAYALWQMHENTQSAKDTLKIVTSAFDAARVLGEKIFTTKKQISTAYKGAEELATSYNSTFKRATQKVSDSGYNDPNVIKIKKMTEEPGE